MKLIQWAFILVELLLFILIIFVVRERLGIGLRYLSIVLCFSYVLIQSKTKDQRILSIAFVLTLIADLFLLVIGRYFVVGVGVFILVQLLYSYRLHHQKDNPLRIYSIIGFLILLVEIIIWGFLKESFDLLLLVTVIYFTFLVSNVFLSFQHSNNSPLFSFGLLMFLFCDIFVGLNNIESYVTKNTLIQRINQSFIDFQWFFYIPSQVLIALSIKKSRSI